MYYFLILKNKSNVPIEMGKLIYEHKHVVN